MADAADRADDVIQALIDVGIVRSTFPAAAGAPGVCRQCDEDMPRLVNGRCGFCRDGRENPAEARR